MTRRDPNDAITAVFERMNAAWNAHDMNAFGALFTDDASFVNIFGHRMVTRAKIIVHHDVIHKRQFRDTTISTEQLEIQRLADDVAVAFLTWRLEDARDPRTDEPVPATTGTITATLRRDDTGWSIATLHNTRLLPLPGPHS